MILTCGITSYKCFYIVRIVKHLKRYYWSLLDHYLKFPDVEVNSRLLVVGGQRYFPLYQNDSYGFCVSLLIEVPRLYNLSITKGLIRGSTNEKAGQVFDTSYCDSINKSSAALILKIMCYHLQVAAPRIHGISILHWLEIGPYTDPMNTIWITCNKSWGSRFVEDKIISNIPCSPQNRIDSNLYYFFLWNTNQPIAKQVGDIFRGS
jgi:hypothetical protein